MAAALTFIRPRWAAPHGVHALATTRSGGVSTGAFASLNLGDAVGDDAVSVAENRRRLAVSASLPSEPLWMRQVHGTEVVVAPGHGTPPCADASVTQRTGHVLAVLTADCIPVLLCDTRGEWVAAVHVGWRGLVAGVLDAVLTHAPGALMAWIGPCIRPPHYEIDAAVRAPLLRYEPSASAQMRSTRPGHWQLDLPAVVSQRLSDRGVLVTDSGRCTAADASLYSFRRDRGRTGRLASLIWLDAR